MQIDDHDRLPGLDHQNPFLTIARNVGDDEPGKGRWSHLGKIETELLGNTTPALINWQTIIRVSAEEQAK